MKQKLVQYNKKGITLVEAVVAVAILLFGIMVPVSIYTNSISNARYAADSVTAYMLAQEGIEEAKRQIFTNINDGSPWYIFSAGFQQPYSSPDTVDVRVCDGTSNTCVVGGISAFVCVVGVTNCGPFWSSGAHDKYVITDPALRLGSWNNGYDYTPWDDVSNFSRTITFEEGYGGNNNNILITVTVSWVSGDGASHKITMKDVAILWKTSP